MKRILLLLTTGAELLEAAAFTDVFGWDGLLGSRELSLTVAASRQPLKMGFGPRIVPELDLEQAYEESFAALAIPGGFPRHGYVKNADERALELIRDFDAAQKPIAVVCTASLLLAKAGIAAGRRLSVYSGYGTDFVSRLIAAGADPVEQKLRLDHHIISAASPGQAIPAALLLLEQLTDGENAAHIAEIMGFTTQYTAYIKEVSV